jgi:hypothetical protein
MPRRPKYDFGAGAPRTNPPQPPRPPQPPSEPPTPPQMPPRRSKVPFVMDTTASANTVEQMPTSFRPDTTQDDVSAVEQGQIPYWTSQRTTNPNSLFFGNRRRQTKK